MSKNTEAARAEKHTPAQRRRRVADDVAAGKAVREIANELGVTEVTVRRDIKALRRAAAERDPWGERTGCAATFIEAAEAALQKTRAAQSGVKHSSTIYLNLVKLEWAMLIKFIELTGQYGKKKSEATDNEREDESKYSNEELLQKAKELGIDVTPFEQALRAAESFGPQTGARGRGIAQPGDLGEAA